MSLPEPGEAALGALARKYTTLVALRRARERDGSLAPRAELAALAREFPGALRELDTTPMDVLVARAEALGRARTGGELEPWMTWLHAWHALARAALRVKPELAARPALAEGTAAEAVAARLRDESGLAVDAAFVRALARPARGRVTAELWAWLGARSGEPAERLRAALFPGRPRV